MGLRINDYGKIIFRHPHVFKGKYGKVVCVAVAKLSGERQGKIKDGLENLLASKPLLRDDFKGKVDQIALDAYFDAMKSKPPSLRGKDYPNKTPEEREKAFVEKSKRGGHALDGGHMHSLLITAQQENEKLRAVIAGMNEHVGAQAHFGQTITLQQCFEHFKKHTTSSSQGARDELMRRVGAAVKLLGPETKHAAITKSMIEDAINGTKKKPVTGYSETEKPRILKEARRFFRELSYPKASDGLGLVNPAVKIKIEQAKIKVVTLDPRPILENPTLPLYWKTLVACIGYGGFRLAESASLEWDRIADGIIAVRATEIYPELKSAMSERDVRPFDDLFPWLEKLKAERGGVGLLFPRVNARRPRRKKAKTAQAKTWFRMVKDKPNAGDLSGALADALNKAKPKDAPKFEKSALRLRHFWETSMRERGLGHLIEAMGGHSDEVGKKHYTKFQQVVKTAKVGSL